MNVKRLSTVLLAGAAIFATGCGNKGTMSKEEAIKFCKEHFTSKAVKYPNNVHIKLQFSDVHYELQSTETQMVYLCGLYGFTYQRGSKVELFEGDFASPLIKIDPWTWRYYKFTPVDEVYINDCYKDLDMYAKKDFNIVFTTNGKDLSIKRWSSAIDYGDNGIFNDHFNESGYLDKRDTDKITLGSSASDFLFNYQIWTTLTY